MKTAIPLPDEVIQQIERLARRLKKSRRELYGEAVAGHLRRARQAIIAALDGVARESLAAPPP